MNMQDAHDDTEEERIRLSIEFTASLLNKIDQIRYAWGLRSRGATVERLLQELLDESITEVPLSEEPKKFPFP